MYSLFEGISDGNQNQSVQQVHRLVRFDSSCPNTKHLLVGFLLAVLTVSMYLHDSFAHC